MIGKNKIGSILVKEDRTRKAVAIDAKISEGELSRIINHESSPTFDTMIMIAKALNKNIWDVFYVD